MEERRAQAPLRFPPCTERQAKWLCRSGLGEASDLEGKGRRGVEAQSCGKLPSCHSVRRRSTALASDLPRGLPRGTQRTALGRRNSLVQAARELLVTARERAAARTSLKRGRNRQGTDRRVGMLALSTSARSGRLGGGGGGGGGSDCGTGDGRRERGSGRGNGEESMTVLGTGAGLVGYDLGGAEAGLRLGPTRGGPGTRRGVGEAGARAAGEPQPGGRAGVGGGPMREGA